MQLKEKLRFEWRTFLTIFICGLLMEGIIFSSYYMGQVSAKKVILLLGVVCVCSVVLTMIPWVQKTRQNIATWFKNLPHTIRKNKSDIIKNILVLVLISILAWISSKVLLRIHPVQIPKHVLPGMYLLSWTAIGTIVYLIAYRERLIHHVEACVAALIILTGATFIFAEPATIGASWDEGVHYYTTMSMSYDFELIRPDVLNEVVDAGPDIYSMFDTTYYDAWSQKIEQKYQNPSKTYYAACRPRYQKWAYVPSAFLLLLCRAFHLPVLTGLAIGKFGFLIVFAMLVYASMKKLQGGKMLVATIALLPQTIFLASNYSYDTWLLGWFMLGMSCFIYEIQHINQKIDIKNLTWMFAAFFVGAGPKAIYIPLLCIAFFLPSKKFESKKQQKIYWGILILIILIVLATFVLPFITSSGGGTGDVRGGSDVNASAQTSFILHNPMSYLVICWNFFKDYVAFSNWKNITSFLAYFGHVPFEMTSAIMLLVVAFTDKCKGDENMRWYHKLVVLVLSLGITVLVITALYITFTPVAATTVAGCQPRYLLPLFFPMLYCIGSARIENKMNLVQYRGVILSLSTFIALYGIWTNIICSYT